MKKHIITVASLALLLVLFLAGCASAPVPRGVASNSNAPQAAQVSTANHV